MNYLTTVLGESPVVVQGVFPCTPQQAFEAWTDPAEIMQWFGAESNSVIRAEIDLKIGGQWRFIFTETQEKTIALEGKYLEIQEAEQLVFSWRHVVAPVHGQPVATAYSKVSINFNKDPKGTMITLVHEDIQTEDGRLGVGKGWQGTFTNFMTRMNNKE